MVDDVTPILPVVWIEAQLSQGNPKGIPSHWYQQSERNRAMEYKRQARWRQKHPYKTRGARFILRSVMGSHIRKSLRGNKNGSPWELLVGYTVTDLKKHLQRQFGPGMSWNNYGEWHIDHIIPINAFNFNSSDDMDFKRCWALKNLQPLWAHENRIKWDRVTQPSQAYLIP